MSSLKSPVNRILSLIIILLLLVGCSGAATPAPAVEEPASQSAEEAAPEEISLVVWWWGEPEAPGTGAWLQQQTQAYTQEYPNVTFELVEQNIDTVITAFRAAAASQSGPDIAFVFSGGVYVMEDAWAGNLAPISDYATADQMASWIDTTSKSYDGKVWTMPFYMQSYLMMYNKDLFSKAGLDPEVPPATLDDMLMTCKTLRDAGITPIATGMRDAFQGGIWFSEMAGQSLSDPYAIQRASVGEGSFTAPEHAGWWNALDQMVKAGCFNEDANSLDLYSGWEVFGRGEAAMLQANDGYLPVAIKNLGDQVVGLMRMPRFDNQPLAEAMCYFSQGLGVTSWSKHKEEAASFLTSLHNQAAVNEFYKTTGIPFASSQFDASLISSTQQRQEFDWIQSRPQLCPEGLMPIQVWETGLLPAVQGIFQQTMTPEAAAQMVEDTAATWRNSQPPDFDQWMKWAFPAK